MANQEKEQMRAWIKNWEELGPILEDLRAANLRQVDTQKAIAAFEIAYKSARLHLAPRETSGLIEQQRLFMRARR